MQYATIPSFRLARPGETPTHFEHARLGITAPLDDYRAVMVAHCGGRSDCVMQGVITHRRQLVPREVGFGREILQEVLGLAEIVTADPDHQGGAWTCNTCGLCFASPLDLMDHGDEHQDPADVEGLIAHQDEALRTMTFPRDAGLGGLDTANDDTWDGIS